MKPRATFITTATAAIALLLVSGIISTAHDLKGIERHSKFKKNPAGPTSASAADRQENFRSLRDIAKAAPQPDFDIAKHLESRGFAGEASIVAFGIAQKTARWPDLMQLNVCFFDGPKTAHNNVMAIYSEVLAFTTLSAVNTGKCNPKKKSHICISFATGDGYWSVVGTEAQTGSQSEATMGLDGLGVNGPLDDAGKGVVRHEILHSIGFEHEHQRPDVDCHFKSFKEIAKIIGWSVSDVKTNFERMKASPNLLMTSFDRDSEMLYQLDAKYFTDPQSPCMITDANNKLSPVDITTLKLLYPKVAPAPNLKSMLQQ